jgi:hypothetical protein
MIATPLLYYLCNMRIFNQELQKFEEIPVANERKPHRLEAGYIAELKNRRTGVGYVVIYLAKEQKLDDSYGKYAVVCTTHNTLVNTTSLPLARSAMKAVDFCEGCMVYGRQN